MPFWKQELLYGPTSISARWFREPNIHGWDTYYRSWSWMSFSTKISLWIESNRNGESIVVNHFKQCWFYISTGAGANIDIESTPKPISRRLKNEQSKFSILAHPMSFRDLLIDLGGLLMLTRRGWLGRLLLGLCTNKGVIDQSQRQLWRLSKLEPRPNRRV